MPIANPSELVAEFKKSGEFDKLRRELLADSQRSSGFDAFKTRIEEIARERIESGQVAYTAPEMLHKELMQEINRFPIVDRFASDVPMLSDNAFKDGIRASIQRILREGQASAKEGAQAPVPPVLPAQDPLVPPGSPSEARLDGKKPETIDPAPLTTAPDTLMSSPGPS
ncbi:hypothetical protein B0H13DRAFT_2303084 [Mycena leptocephala]|nr:hypothetical protein B0H13DRAFT_2303084 [Mycena leptocephala]